MSALQVLSGLVAGVVSLTALKAGAVDLQDERDVRQRGFDIIYEARDLDLDQSTRDGLTQYRKNIDSTKARIKEAERILDNNLDPLIQKKYWYAKSAVLQPCFRPLLQLQSCIQASCMKVAKTCGLTKNASICLAHVHASVLHLQDGGTICSSCFTVMSMNIFVGSSEQDSGT